MIIDWLSGVWASLTLKSAQRGHSRYQGQGRRRAQRKAFTPAECEVLEVRQMLSAFAVTNTLDNTDPGSLRWAVGQANANPGTDSIVFDSTVFSTSHTITLTAGQLDLSDSATTTIVGPGAGLLSISGNNASRVFEIDNGAWADLHGLTITGGSVNGGGISGMGGGLLNDGGNVTLTDCNVSGNTASLNGGGIAGIGATTLSHALITNNSAIGSGGGLGFGGGVYSYGPLTVTDTTISGNSVSKFIQAKGGGVFSNGPLTVTRSTISGNSVAGIEAGAGGIVSQDPYMTMTDSVVSGNSSTGGAGGMSILGGTLTNMTVSGNTAVQGGGGIFSSEHLLIMSQCTVSGNTTHGNGGGIYAISGIDLTNTIVAHSTGQDIAVGGGTTLRGMNLIDDGSATGPNVIVADPLLAPLENYGGPTQSMALLPGSPAIDAAGASTVVTDQRGVSRAQGTAPDIGAFESQGFTINATSGSGQSAAKGATFSAPLVATVTPVNSLEPVVGGTITFHSPSSGASATVGGPVTIASDGTASVVATANNVDGSYNVTADASGIASSAIWGLGNGTTLLVFSNLQSHDITYGTSSTTLSGHLASGTVSPVNSSVSIKLGSVTQSATVDASGNFSSVFDTTQLAVGSSPYQVTYSFAATATFGSTTDSQTHVSVSQAALTITASNQSKTYGSTLTLGSSAFTISGLKNTDTVGSITLTCNGTGATAAVGG